MKVTVQYRIRLDFRSIRVGHNRRYTFFVVVVVLISLLVIKCYISWLPAWLWERAYFSGVTWIHFVFAASKTDVLQFF